MASVLRKHPRDLAAYPWQCEVCGKCYKTKSHRTQHYKVHVGVREHVCSVCGAAFLYKSTLVTHQRFVHQGEKPHVCTLCGKAFSWPTHLRVHMNTHSDISGKTQPCPICQRVFTPFYIQQHIKTHAPSLGRPFSCTKCGKTFKSERSEQMHQRVHSAYKPYTCPRCAETFSHNTGLKIHMRGHTGERPYRCGLCPATFSQSIHLRTHMKGVHRLANPPVCRMGTAVAPAAEKGLTQIHSKFSDLPVCSVGEGTVEKGLTQALSKFADPPPVSSAGGGIAEKGLTQAQGKSTQKRAGSKQKCHSEKVSDLTAVNNNREEAQHVDFDDIVMEDQIGFDVETEENGRAVKRCKVERIDDPNCCENSAASIIPSEHVVVKFNFRKVL